MFVVFAAEARTVKMYYFARLWYHSIEKSISTWQFPVKKVIKFRPCWDAPYLWLVNCIDSWHYRISWENGGQNTKTPAVIAGALFPFPRFRTFLPPRSPPLFAPATQATALGTVLFKIIHRSFFLQQWPQCLWSLSEIYESIIKILVLGWSFYGQK